uniref:Delta 1 crystallin (Fragments) n=1 Tax=Anas platyrhynchos TaxID=8839 RepID=Q7LZ23_ANAPL
GVIVVTQSDEDIQTANERGIAINNLTLEDLK